ncbi:MAG: ATP-binding protein [Gemmatimonadales bacterium]
MPQPGLVIRLLGAPSVSLADGRQDVPALGGKAIALLAYLALEPRAHSREELAGLLWGESPEPEARASLRQTLRAIRAAFGDAIRSNRSQVELSEPPRCDVTELRRVLTEEPRGVLVAEAPSFLNGFSVRHAPQFEEWVSGIRSALLRDYHNALSVLAREAMAQRRWRDASQAADRWLASDPLSEDAARLAVEALYLSGNRGGALARFAGYREALFRETGCEPGRGLQTLMQRVEADRPSPVAHARPEVWDTPALSFESGLIGREAEWKRLTEAWSAARRGEGRVLLLQGEAGVGKSRLIDEFLRSIVAEGGTVLRGRSYDGRAGVPYEPVADALRNALGAPGLAAASAEWLVEVTRLVPELRQRFPALAEPEQPADSTAGWRLSEGIAHLLLALAGERPVVVSIDDLQWCDEETCNLLRYLIRRLERAPVLWLGTVTLGEVEREAPAARLCRVLRAKSHADTIELAPLTEEQIWQMIRELGHVSTPTGARRLAARVHRITGGNPFYAIELLKTMLAQGTLAADQTSGEWTVPASGVAVSREYPLSQSVQDLIAERVDRLPAELKELLITVAVAGSGGRPDVLSHVHGISRLRAAAMADSLVERRLMVEEAGVYRCAHPVIAHVVRDAITVPRRREVHRMVALALKLAAPAGDARSSAGEIALHADRGGEPALAYRYALMASEAAVHRYAFEEALSWLDLAAGAAQGADETDAVNRRTADLLEAAGWSAAPERRPMPVTREIVSEDLDLPVRG